jgi:hypothetical protein
MSKTIDPANKLPPEGESIIYLRSPFIKHYAGTIFKLQKPVIHPDWLTGDFGQEKMFVYDKTVYFLPDGGTGRECWLPLRNTKFCPKSLPWNNAILDGPCRITSILLDSIECPQYKLGEYPIPDGYAPFTLIKYSNEIKNILHIDNITTSNTYDIQIIDKISGFCIYNFKISLFPSDIHLNSLLPGFYKFIFTDDKDTVHELSLIKLFPVYITNDSNGNLCTMPTIW